jgi:hypothetical protein
MDSRVDVIRATGSRDADVGTHCANTPSGILRDDSVHATQRTCDRNEAVTVRASVVLPTPAADQHHSPAVTTGQRRANRIALHAAIHQLPTGRHEIAVQESIAHR